MRINCQNVIFLSHALCNSELLVLFPSTAICGPLPDHKGNYRMKNRIVKFSPYMFGRIFKYGKRFEEQQILPCNLQDENMSLIIRCSEHNCRHWEIRLSHYQIFCNKSNNMIIIRPFNNKCYAGVKIRDPTAKSERVPMKAKCRIDKWMGAPTWCCTMLWCTFVMYNEQQNMPFAEEYFWSGISLLTQSRVFFRIKLS